MPPFKRPKPTTVVLGLLCVMYLITYVDRVNISTAADSIKRELELSNTQLGFLQSAFGYPYLVFQIFGGWIGDRFGPRRTLFLCGLIWATATILTGFAGGLTSLFMCRLLVGIARVATGNVAPSPIPTSSRHMNSMVRPPANPVRMVAVAQIKPHRKSVRRGPKRSPIQPPKI